MRIVCLDWPQIEASVSDDDDNATDADADLTDSRPHANIDYGYSSSSGTGLQSYATAPDRRNQSGFSHVTIHNRGPSSSRTGESRRTSRDLLFSSSDSINTPTSLIRFRNENSNVALPSTSHRSGEFEPSTQFASVGLSGVAQSHIDSYRSESALISQVCEHYSTVRLPFSSTARLSFCLCLKIFVLHFVCYSDTTR